MQKIKFNFEIELQNVDDQLTTALEGGSNYWYSIVDTQISSPKEFKRNENIHYEFLDKVYQGATLEIQDIENNTRLGVLNIHTIQHGLEIMQKQYPTHFANLIEETGDAETADVFFQLCIMNKIVYG
ncbi:MAG: hypothetical protein ACC656_05130 [Candidatus Heimdallarchaeota archaeon]